MATKPLQATCAPAKPARAPTDAVLARRAALPLPAPGDLRVAHLLATVALFERDAIEEAIDAFIELLDARDPDPDFEDSEHGMTAINDSGRMLGCRTLADHHAEHDEDSEDVDEDCCAEDRGEGGSWPEIHDGKQHDALHAYDDDEREEGPRAVVERQPYRDRIRATRCRRTSNVYQPFTLPSSSLVVSFGRQP